MLGEAAQRRRRALCSPGEVVVVLTIVLALDEVFIGFAGQPAAVVRVELAAACADYDCPLDEDTLTAFAQEISAGHRVEIDAGAMRVAPAGSDGALWDGGEPF